MNWLVKIGLLVAIWGAVSPNISVAQQAETTVTTGDLLKDSKFKSAYLSSLGPKAKEKWLATMTNSSLVQKVSVAGDVYQVAAPCKPHDCGENNLLVLYGPAKGVVYGKLFEKGKTTFIGSPSAAMSAEIEKMWLKEFRQR